MNANDRRLEILRVLCERKFDTISNLASEFGVCIRTIKYDIETLSLSHPICTQPGNGGGVYIMDGYRLGMKFFTEEQTAFVRETFAEIGYGEVRHINPYFVVSPFRVIGWKFG